MAKPVVFSSRVSKRCMVCLDDEMSKWVKDSITLTIKSGHPKPSIRRVHMELRKEFPDKSPRHESSLNRHLNDHEDIWGAWPSESS